MAAPVTKQHWSYSSILYVRVLWVALDVDVTAEGDAVLRLSWPGRELDGMFWDAGGMSTIFVPLMYARSLKEDPLDQMTSRVIRIAF